MALLTASALGKTIRENDIDSLYYFYIAKPNDKDGCQA